MLVTWLHVPGRADQSTTMNGRGDRSSSALYRESLPNILSCGVVRQAQ